MGGPRRPTHGGKPNFQPATYHSPLGPASKPPGSIRLHCTVAAQALYKTVHTWQCGANTRIQSQGLQRMKALQRCVEIRIATQRLPDIDAPGPVPGLRPLVHDHYLVELEVFLARSKMPHRVRQEQGLGIGVCLPAARYLKAPPAETVPSVPGEF